MMNETNIEDKKKKLNEKEALAFLGVGLSTLRRARANGLIGFFRYNRKILHSIEQLEAYQNRHEVKPITGKSRGLTKSKLV